MKKRGEWMDPDFNKRDSFHATIKHPLMSAEEWTEAYENAWKTFYSKENMIRNLARWVDRPKNYWNLMSIFFWYKNAALIEKQHPMIAGFFRLKDRKNRRPGFAIDPVPMHLWKRAKEVTRLLITWTKFVKEMEEVWLQTHKKTETEERWLEQIQKIQSDIWQALRIGEIQKIYNNAKETLPERARALLDPATDAVRKLARRGYQLDLDLLSKLVSERNAAIHAGDSLRADAKGTANLVRAAGKHDPHPARCVRTRRRKRRSQASSQGFANRADASAFRCRPSAASLCRE